MSGKRVLCDGFNPVKLKIQESSDGRLIATGEFGRCGQNTENGRMYPRDLMEREIKRLGSTIDNRSLYGELDHPEDGKTKLKRVSHIITDLRIEHDGRVVGTLEVLEDTDNGKQLKGLVESGVTIGVSSRGLGSVKKINGKNVVKEDFKLLTYDVVADPAVSTAQPQYERTESNEVSESGKGEDMDELNENESDDTSYIVDQVTERVVGKLDQKMHEMSEMKDSIESLLADNLEKMHESSEEEHEYDESPEDNEEDLSSLYDAELEHKMESLQKMVAERDSLIEELKGALLESGMSYALLTQMHYIPESKRDHFLEMVKDSEGYSSVSNFEERVKVVAEEFKETGRWLPDPEELLDENKNMKERLEKSESKFRNVKSNYDDLLSEHEKVRSVADEAGREIKSLREDNRKIKSRNEELVEALRDAKSAILNERNERRELSEEVDILESELRDVEQEADRYKEELDEHIDALNESEEIIDNLEDSIREKEVELYKVESAVGSSKPNTIKRTLNEANSKREVDDKLEEHRSRKRPKKTSPTGETSDSGSDVLFESKVRDRILNVANGENSVPRAEINSALESSPNTLNENNKKVDSESNRSQNVNNFDGKAEVPGLDPDDALNIARE